MYSLTIQHNLQNIHMRWTLKPIDEETVVIGKLKFSTSSNEYSASVLDYSTIIVIYKNEEIARLYFHPERLMYFLQFIQSGSVVREYYLEEEVLDATQKYTVEYTV